MQAIENDPAVTLLPVTEGKQQPVTNTEDSYEGVRFNAVKHGILARHTVLPHEDRAEFNALHEALISEHDPQGMTEAHLVEELASIMWRKQRVLLAEGAGINQQLKRVSEQSKHIASIALPFERGLNVYHIDLPELINMTEEEVSARHRETVCELESLNRAQTILNSNGKTAYKRALRTLPPDIRDGWLDDDSREEYPETTEGLNEYIQDEMFPVYAAIEKEARYHTEIKAQVLGNGLSPQRLEKLSRYETHLDRKFERTLAMLIKLKELRPKK